jgi:hypothetical protein
MTSARFHTAGHTVVFNYFFSCVWLAGITGIIGLVAPDLYPVQGRGPGPTGTHPGGGPGQSKPQNPLYRLYSSVLASFRLSLCFPVTMAARRRRGNPRVPRRTLRVADSHPVVKAER